MIKKLILLASILAAVGLVAQTPRPVYITSDEASKHLIRAGQLFYPPEAEMARIQGNVILQVRIDEKGSPTVRGILRGHPLLTKAASEAVARSRYRPVEIDGKPTAVMTLVMVRIGNPANHDAEDQAELRYQDYLSIITELLEEAFAEDNTFGAEQSIFLAKWTLGPRFADSTGWLDRMGRLRVAQHKFDEAEQYFKQALAPHREFRPADSPESASVLADLGELYAKQNRNDLARENLSKALTISQKNFKDAGKKMSPLHQKPAQAIVREAWALSKLAVQRNDTQDAKAQCHTALEFQSNVSATDRDALGSFCSTLDGPPPSK